MKYGIYADIHGNLDAAKVVIKYLKEETDFLLYVGDIVGYGPEPNECIELVKNCTLKIVAGNHDQAVAGLMDIDYFSFYAKESILWTQEILRGDYKDFLSKLKLVLIINENITLVHSSLDNPSGFDYIVDVAGSIETFRKLTTRICFIGHTHIPMIFRKKDMSQELPLAKTVKGDFKEELKPGYKYIVNVGSVGQPRDGNPKACCVIYDTEKDTLKFKRLDYPITNVQKKIIEKKMPQFLSIRLSKGY